MELVPQRAALIPVHVLQTQLQSHSIMQVSNSSHPHPYSQGICSGKQARWGSFNQRANMLPAYQLP